MKIKTSFLAIYNLGLSPFARQLISAKISYPYAAYKVCRVFKKVLDYCKDIEARRMDLVKEYGVKVLDENGKETKDIKVPPGEKLKEFSEKFNAFLNKENEFSFEHLLDLEDLFDIKLSVEEIILLTPILDKSKIDNYLLKQEKEKQKKEITK